MSDTTDFAPHIPDAVRRASLAADELARAAGIRNVPPAPESEAEPPGEPVTTVVDPQVDPQPDSQVDPQPDLQPEPQPQTQPQQIDWEQRYNTLQGKYNSEMAELRGQLRATQDMIASIQQAPPQPEPRTRETSFSLPQRDAPPEDVEAYGQDLIHGVQRWSMLAVEPKLSAFEQRLALLEGNHQQTVSMTVAQRVEAALDRTLPNWREINIDPDFIAWLGRVDPFSGQTRKRLIDEAYGGGDAARTIAFFQAFIAEHTAVRQPPGTQTVQTDADRLPLADLAVPGRGQVAAPPTPGAPQRRIWSNADIQTFYRQKQRGMWRGREAEADRIEADIFAAGSEGRVR